MNALSTSIELKCSQWLIHWHRKYTHLRSRFCTYNSQNIDNIHMFQSFFFISPSAHPIHPTNHSLSSSFFRVRLAVAAKSVKYPWWPFSQLFKTPPSFLMPVSCSRLQYTRVYHVWPLQPMLKDFSWRHSQYNLWSLRCNTYVLSATVGLAITQLLITLAT